MTLSRHKNAATVVAEVLMTRQLHRGSFLLVEGEDDHKFWRSRIDSKRCELVIGNGKENVEGGVTRLEQRSVPGILGVVDDDFDTLEKRPPRSPNVIGTDTHDLECTLLRSPALERLLAELGRPDKIKRFEEQGRSVREALLERGLEFGRLRWAAQRQGWRIPFPNFPVKNFCDPATWEMSRESLHQALIECGAVASWNDLQAALEALPSADPWHVCQGHDLVGILRIGLLRVLGDLHKSGKGEKELAMLLRSAFDDQWLYHGHLGSAMRDWEQRNLPYRVLLPIGLTG